jgi:predicted Rossmann fold nucleotide-binding protein DprA/Smf involved in DNA uptake
VERISKQAGKLQPPKKKAPAKKVKAKTSPKKKKASVKNVSVIDSVFDVVKRSKKGTTIATLKEKTGFDSRQLSNALYKLSKRGKIASKTRGVYIKK